MIRGPARAENAARRFQAAVSPGPRPAGPHCLRSETACPAGRGPAPTEIGRLGGPRSVARVGVPRSVSGPRGAPLGLVSRSPLRRARAAKGPRVLAGFPARRTGRNARASLRPALSAPRLDSAWRLSCAGVPGAGPDSGGTTGRRLAASSRVRVLSGPVRSPHLGWLPYPRPCGAFAPG